MAEAARALGKPKATETVAAVIEKVAAVRHAVKHIHFVGTPGAGPRRHVRLADADEAIEAEVAK